jgi:hypothetical protein
MPADGRCTIPIEIRCTTRDAFDLHEEGTEAKVRLAKACASKAAMDQLTVWRDELDVLQSFKRLLLDAVDIGEPLRRSSETAVNELA